jgi:hypothetical protein
MLGLQVLGYFDCFPLPSRNSVNVSETRVEDPTVSGDRVRQRRSRRRSTQKSSRTKRRTGEETLTKY